MDTNSNTPKNHVTKTLFICHFNPNNKVPRAFASICVYGTDNMGNETYQHKQFEFNKLTRASAARLEAYGYRQSKKDTIAHISFQVQIDGLVISLEHFEHTR